jgi:hypothetical protein
MLEPQREEEGGEHSGEDGVGRQTELKAIATLKYVSIHKTRIAARTSRRQTASHESMPQGIELPELAYNAIRFVN